MNLNLPSEVNDFVKGLVAQGRFDSAEDAIVEGIKLLMGRERLRCEIQKGVAQLDAGELHDEATVFSDIDAEIDRVDAEQQGAELMPSLRYSTESKEDLKQIARFIARDKPAAARKWVMKLPRLFHKPIARIA